MEASNDKQFTILLTLRIAKPADVMALFPDGNEVQGPATCRLRFGEIVTERSLFPNADAAVTLVLSFTSGVISKVVASWLYDKLKHRAVSLSVHKRTIEITPEGITRLIDETVESRQ